MLLCYNKHEIELLNYNALGVILLLDNINLSAVIKIYKKYHKIFMWEMFHYCRGIYIINYQSVEIDY